MVHTLKILCILIKKQKYNTEPLGTNNTIKNCLWSGWEGNLKFEYRILEKLNLACLLAC